MRHRVLLGGGVLLGLMVLTMSSRADEAAAVRAIKKVGGRVEVDADRPGKPVVAVILRSTKVTDAALKELKELKSLQTLDLSDTKVTDAGLKDLRNSRACRDWNSLAPRSRTRG